MVKVKCNYCGKELERRIGLANKNNYCDYKCLNGIKRKSNNIIIKDTYAEMIVKHKENTMTVLIDIEDISLVNRYKWTPAYSKYIDGYYMHANSRMGTNTHVKLHRIIMNCPTGMCIDHINRNPLDNRKSNLRICTHAENMQNKGIPKNNKSGHQYIGFHKASKGYRIRICRNKKSVDLGAYKTLEEAIKIRDIFLKNNPSTFGSNKTLKKKG